MYPIVPLRNGNTQNPPQEQTKIMRSYFALGTFQVHSYTIRVSFDQIRTCFKARVNNKSSICKHVELSAPFSHYTSISTEQLERLSGQLRTEYSIHLIKTDDSFKVQFLPKLCGGGQTSSKQAKTKTTSHDAKESKHEKKEAEDFADLIFSSRRRRSSQPVLPPNFTLANLQNTHQLAQALKQTDPAHASYEELKGLALKVIEAYAKHAVKTPDLLKEVTILASSNNQMISQAIIKLLFTELDAARLLDVALLEALGEAIRATNPKYLDANDLIAILTGICERYETFHEQKTTLPRLYLLLCALSTTLEAMGDANVEKLSYDAMHDPLYRTLDALSNLGESTHGEWQIAIQAAYAKEALKRVGHDKNKFILFFERIVSFGKGVISLKQAVADKDPAALMEAYKNFKEALHKQKKPQSWYEELRFMQILIDHEQFECFEEELQEKMEALPQEEYPLLISGVVHALMETVSHHQNLEIRLFSIQLLGSLYRDDEKWGKLSPFLAKLQLDEVEKMVTPVKVSVLKHLKNWVISSEERSLRQAAQDSFEKIQLTAKSELQKKWLKEAGIPEDLKTLAPKPKAPQPIPKRSVELLQAAKSKSKQISELFLEMQKNVLDSQEIKTLLATYIPPCGSLSSSFEGAFPLEEEVLRFLNGKEKVLLLLGGSGAGKSIFGKYLTYTLWKQRRAPDLIPLFISLAALTRPGGGAIEEALASHGFTAQQIQQLKREQSFVFFMDGYDEIGKKHQLYQENHLKDWKAKVIISCRTQYLSGNDNSALFAPFEFDLPRRDLFREIWLTPFTDQQIDAYLQKYLTGQSSNALADWQDPKKYKEQIDQVPGLLSLISTPFLLYITADVLPGIVQQHSKDKSSERLALLRRDLYDAFTNRWFIRAEAKLREARQLLDFDGDIKLSFVNYCKKLASKMFEKKVTIVKYVASVWGEEASEWESYFGRTSPLPLLRSGAPIQKVGVDEYAFLHKSLLEYFAYREDFDKMAKIASPPSEKEEEKKQESKPHSRLTAQDSALRTQDFSLSLPHNFTTQLLIEEPSVVQFYADAVQASPSFKALLFQILEKSKTDPNMAIAASNSITILNLAEVPFSGLNLAQIRVPEAYLQGAIFDKTVLDGADLSHANLVDAFLGHCSLKNAQMLEVQFGQRPYLKHDSTVFDVAISPNGKWLASAVNSGIVQLWDMQTGKELKRFCGHSEGVFACAFSPDNKLLASASDDETIRLWDVQTGREVMRLKGYSYIWHTDKMRYCIFSPNGKWLASIGKYEDRISARLWDVQTGKELRKFVGGDSYCAFSPDSKWLAYPSSDNILCLWEVQTGKELMNGLSHKGINFCAFSIDGKWLASAGRDKRICLWDLQTGSEGMNLLHSDSVRCCAFSSNGKWLASVAGKNVFIWDLQTGKILKRFDGHTISPEACTFSPDNKWLASAGLEDKTVRLWDLKTVKETKSMIGHTDTINSCVFSPDGKTFASASHDGTVRLWDRQTRKELKTFRGHTMFVNYCTFSPDGQWLASASYHDDTVRLWDVQIGKELMRFEIKRKHYLDNTFSFCAFSLDSKWLAASAGYMKETQLWDLQSGKKLMTLTHESPVECCIFSSDGKQLITASHNINLWDLGTGKKLKYFVGHTDAIQFCVFSPDNNWLASASDDKTVRLWDMQTGKELRSLLGHTGRVYSCAFSPNGKWLASASEDKTIRLWDPQTGKQIQCLVGHASGVNSCAFSPDGKSLISAGSDKTIRLWKLYDQKGELDPLLEWTIPHVLNAPGTNLEGVKGLSDFNRLLLEQNGAIKSQDEDDRKEATSS